MKNYNGKLKISTFKFQMTLLNQRDLVKYNVTCFATKGERVSSKYCWPKIPFKAELFIAVLHKKITTASENRATQFELTLYKTNGSALFTLPEVHQCVPSPRHFVRCFTLLVAQGLDWVTCRGEADSFSY